tara:strand:- start:2250 stop:2732 length:483 start_codon:yes stop_codon:yes gene_type:complete
MKNVKIKFAVKSDMRQVLNLIKELALFEKSPDQAILTVEDLVRDGFGKIKLFECFIAQIKNEIVGIALFYPRYSTWCGKTFHLEDLIVSKKWKSKGIGTALYNKFLSYSLKKNVNRVEWVVLNWNKNAIDFYNKSGAKTLDDWRVVQMTKEDIKKHLDTL